MRHAKDLKSAWDFQEQCIVTFRSVLDFFLNLLSFLDSLAVFQVQKKHYTVIVLETDGYLSPGNSFIYFRDSFFFVTMCYSIAYVQKIIHILRIQQCETFMLIDPNPRSRNKTLLGPTCHPKCPFSSLPCKAGHYVYFHQQRMIRPLYFIQMELSNMYFVY